MQNALEIKNRIKAVKETAQITKAMEVISVAKRRKANVKYNNNLQYFLRVRSTIKDILTHSGNLINHDYLKHREGNRTGYVVIASDKGLAGAYNRKVCKKALDTINEVEEKYIFTIGQMAREFFTREGLTPDIDFLYAAQNPTLEDARRITSDLMDLYDSDHLDEIYVVYTQKITNSKMEPIVLKLLPLEIKDFKDIPNEKEYKSILDFEPSPNALVATLVPQYIIGMLYSCLIQSIYCEHEERMITMNSATNNANELMDKLNLDFNRSRQAAITREISEVASSTIIFNKD